MGSFGHFSYSPDHCLPSDCHLLHFADDDDVKLAMRSTLKGLPTKVYDMGHQDTTSA